MVHVFCTSPHGVKHLCEVSLNFQVALNLWSGHENCNTQRAITQKVGKPELWLMCSAHCLMVFNICVKFHKNMSSGFKLMERTENC